jgi:hypothetical protein
MKMSGHIPPIFPLEVLYMHSIKDAVTQSFIRENHPAARLVSWDDPDSGLKFYTAEQLQTLQADWFPLCCYQDATSKKVVYGGRSGIVHTYTEGETGAGKTSRFAMQSIRALSCLQEKPSFVVVDIHGELAENLYPHLQANGYAVKVLNCDDPERSDTYNPFQPLVERCLESGSIDNEVIKGIRKIAEIMQPVTSRDDPIWEQGARSYTNGCILDKFEDLLAGQIPRESITLYNIIENHYWLRRQICGHVGDLLSIEHYRSKGSGALSMQKMMAVTNNSEKTRSSYFGVIENHYDSFGQPSLYQLSSNSTIDIDDFMERPTAIFIQSGSTRIGDDLVSLLVNEIYTATVIRGRTTARKMLPRKIHCFLDEFANSNIAPGQEFIKMLTTSRKFGMFWHLFVQCDAQLDNKYDAATARIIRANCTEIFMGSNEYETLVRFARSCGQKTVESLGSLVHSGVPTLETVDLITADKLSLTPHGQVYIKSARHPLLLSYIEAFYRCEEFVPVEDIRSVYPKNTFHYQKTAFFPDEIDAYTRRVSRNSPAKKPEGQGSASAFFAAATAQTEDAAQHSLRDALEQLTCIPEELAAVLHKKLQGIRLSSDEKEMLVSPILHYNLIEAFIQNHDYTEKADWENGFQKEYDIARTLVYMPQSFVDAFAKALREFRQELTLKDIQQIKSFISP